MRYLPALESLADTLTAAGIRTALNWADLNAPAVWITPGNVDEIMLNGSALATAHVALIAPALPESHALAIIDDLTAAVIPALQSAGYPIVAADVVAVGGSTAGGPPLPALRLTTEIHLGE